MAKFADPFTYETEEERRRREAERLRRETEERLNELQQQRREAQTQAEQTVQAEVVKVGKRRLADVFRFRELAEEALAPLRQQEAERFKVVNQAKVETLKPLQALRR